MSKNCSFDKNSLNTSMNSKMYQCTLSCIKQKYANLKLMKIMSDKFVVINLEDIHLYKHTYFSLCLFLPIY